MVTDGFRRNKGNVRTYLSFHEREIWFLEIFCWRFNLSNYIRFELEARCENGCGKWLSVARKRVREPGGTPPPRNPRSTLWECLLIWPFLTSLLLIIIAVIVIYSDRKGGRQLRWCRLLFLLSSYELFLIYSVCHLRLNAAFRNKLMMSIQTFQFPKPLDCCLKVAVTAVCFILLLSPAQLNLHVRPPLVRRP